MLAVNIFVGFSAYVSIGAWLENGAPCVFGFIELSAPTWLNVLGTIAAFSISLNIAFGFGMVLFPIRLAVNQFLDSEHNGRDIPYKRHILITTVLCLCIGALASILMASTKQNGIQIVGFVLDVSTSFFGANVAFTLPGLMFYKLKEQKSRVEMCLCIVITVFGLCASLMGITKIIKSLL